MIDKFTINKSSIKLIVIVLFGLVFPVLLIVSSYHGLKTTKDTISRIDTTESLLDTVASFHDMEATSSDYALYSLLYLENANKTTLINKQVIKSTVIEIGFAVMSMGLMLIVLGIGKKEGLAIALADEDKGFDIDLKVVSAGTVVFLSGALMSAISGTVKNEYHTSVIPSYQTLHPELEDSADVNNAETKHNLTVSNFKGCEAASNNVEEKHSCFYQLFYKEYSDELK